MSNDNLTKRIAGIHDHEIPEDSMPDSEQPESIDANEALPTKMLNLKITFTPEGVKIDLSSNLSPLEQLGAIDIFRQHILQSALGDKG